MVEGAVIAGRSVGEAVVGGGGEGRGGGGGGGAGGGAEIAEMAANGFFQSQPGPCFDLQFERFSMLIGSEQAPARRGLHSCYCSW